MCAADILVCLCFASNGWQPQTFAASAATRFGVEIQLWSAFVSCVNFYNPKYSPPAADRVWGCHPLFDLCVIDHYFVIPDLIGLCAAGL